MARQPPGSPVLEALLERVRVRRARDLRRRRHLRARLPGRDRHRQARQGAARPPAQRARRAGRAARSPGAGTRSSGPRARACGAAQRRPGRAGAPMRGASRAARRALSSELVPEWPREHAAPGAGRAAGDAARRRRRRLPARLRQPHLRRARRRRRAPSLSLAEALVAVSRARRPAAVDPARRRRALLRDAVELEGLRAAPGGWPTTRSTRSGAGATAASCPVVFDASSCTLGLAEESVALLSELNAERHARLERARLDRVGRASGCCPRLRSSASSRAVAVHPTCSSRHLGLDARAARRSPRELADEVVVPTAATCCGFAGDRGMLHPELPAAATADEAAELAGRGFDAYLCSNRTCEIGLQQGTGRPYEIVRLRARGAHGGGRMKRQEHGASVPCPARGRAVRDPQSLGRRLGEGVRRARLRGAGDDQLGLRLHARAARRRG